MKTIVVSLSLILFLVSTVRCVCAQDTAESLAVAPLKNRMYDIHPGQQYGYAGVTSGLRILDFSQLPQIREISSIVLPHAATSAVPASGIVYVAQGPAGVFTVDVNEPTAPVVVATIETPGSAMMVDLAGDILAIADGSAGVTIVNVANPANPRQTARGRWDGYVRGVRFYLHELYICAGKTGVVLMETDTEGDAQLLGTSKTAGDARDICFHRQYAFVADGIHGVTVLDISDPKQPAMLSNTPVEDVAHGVAFDETEKIVYVADGLDGIGVFSFEKTTELERITQVNAEGGYANKVAVYGPRLFVANDFKGLLILDINDPKTPAVLR